VHWPARDSPQVWEGLDMSGLRLIQGGWSETGITPESGPISLFQFGGSACPTPSRGSLTPFYLLFEWERPPAKNGDHQIDVFLFTNSGVSASTLLGFLFSKVDELPLGGSYFWAVSAKLFG
jgi:hypothetical protein